MAPTWLFGGYRLPVTRGLMGSVSETDAVELDPKYRIFGEPPICTAKPPDFRSAGRGREGGSPAPPGAAVRGEGAGSARAAASLRPAEARWRLGGGVTGCAGNQRQELLLRRIRTSCFRPALRREPWPATPLAPVAPCRFYRRLAVRGRAVPQKDVHVNRW